MARAVVHRLWSGREKSPATHAPSWRCHSGPPPGDGKTLIMVMKNFLENAAHSV